MNEETNKGEISDGYHTFNELYDHRHTLFSIVCNRCDGWKSKLHDDGTMIKGWFIAGIDTPEGTVTYHIPIDWWDLFVCKELERAPRWDGHTSKQVITRLLSLDKISQS